MLTNYSGEICVQSLHQEKALTARSGVQENYCLQREKL